jgi:trehalose 6-phosphate phosphatase
VLVLTDFDGTLSDITRRPDQAVLAAEARAGLEALATLPAVTAGVVSGRRLTDVHERTASLTPYVAGLHGLEIDGPDARFRHGTLEAVAPIIANLAALAAEKLAWCDGVLIENKTYALTCHVRRVPPGDADRALEEFVALARQPITSGVLRILTGSQACELLPNVGWHKGRAAEWIRTHVAATTTRQVAIIYLGDDRTDEDAFGALGAGDIGIGVGERPLPHLIGRRLAGPAAVGQFLQHLAARHQYNQ